MWEGEFQNRKKNGERFWEHATISSIRNKEGIITNYLAIKEDIADRKRLEEQLRQSQKMEALGLLAGGIAHDFNNVLTVIIGYGDTLLTGQEVDAAGKEMLGEIMCAAERAAQLIRGLLAFGHRQIMNPQLCDLNEIIRSTQKFLARVIGEDVQLSIEAEEEALTVFGDSGQIEQVLVNLATNARDAMPKGGLLSFRTSSLVVDESFVQSHGYGAPGRYALVTAADTGCGMGRATRERIFEPFFTTKERGKGTGLGMAVVYGIVKQHNGYIDVYSEKGRGTTFKVYLPLVDSDGTRLCGATDADGAKTGTETILVVEDEAAVRRLMEMTLTRLGYKVIVAENGVHAVEQFRKHREEIELVVMDIIMPGINGREAAEQIKAIEPKTTVLYTSGYTADIVISRGEIEDGAALVMKPVHPLDLARKVREMLGRKSEDAAHLVDIT